MIKIERRFPNFFSGFEETEHEFSTKEEFLNLDWIKHATEMKNFHTLAVSPAEYEGSYDKLMTFSHYDEKYGGCKIWFVIGYVLEGDLTSIGIPTTKGLYAHHLDGCPQKVYQHNKCNCGFRT